MKRSCVLIFVFIQLSVYAQKTGQALADSLIQLLPSMREDSNKVKALAKVGETFYYMAPAKGIEYVRQGLDISQRLNYQKGVSRMENLLGLLIGDTGNNTLSRDYFNRSYAVNKKIGFSFGMISNLNNIGRSYQRESDFTSALDYFLKALTVAQEIGNDEQIALVGTNLTASYFSQKDYENSMRYAEMTLKHAKLSHSLNNEAKALFEMGNIKGEEGDTSAAREFFKQAYNTYVKINNKSGMAQVMVEEAPLEYPDYAKAITLMKHAQIVIDSVGSASVYSIANLANLGNSYYELSLSNHGSEKLNLLREGEIILLRGLKLCQETNNHESLASISETLSKIKESQGDYRASLKNFKTYYAINDSLFSQDKKNQLAALESKNKISLKDKALAISNLELTAERRTKLVLLLGILALGIIGFLLIYQNRVRQKANSQLKILNSRLDEANQVKTKIFGILSHDLRSPVANLINYLYLLKNEPEQLAAEGETSQQQIGQSAETLLQTLETMLLWSKEQMNYFKPDIKSVDVDELFSHLRNFFPPSEFPQIRYHNTGSAQISADENYLRVIMRNLTSNAIYAVRDQKHGSIDWEAGKHGPHTVLFIKDNGPGMNPEQIKALYSNDIVVNSRTGFGFRMILDLARAMHYQIAVESMPGAGTTCVISSLTDA